MVSTPFRPSAGALLTLALFFSGLFLTGTGRANPASGLLDLLDPGIGRDLALGGDPFATGPGDGASWWRGSLQAERPTVAYGLEYFEPISAWLTDGRGWVRHFGHEIVAASSVDVGGGRLYGQAGVSHRDQELMVDDLGNTYALTGQGAQGEALLRYRHEGAGLTLQASVPVGYSDPRMRDVPFGIGIQLTEPGRFVVQASGVKRRYDPALDFLVEEEAINSNLNLARMRWVVDTRLYLGNASWLGYSWGTNEFGEIEHLTEALRYEIIPTGYATEYEVEAAVGRTKDFVFLLRGRWLEFDLGGSAYWGGQRFAKVNYFRGDQRTGTLAWEKTCGKGNRWLADLTLTEIRGRTWGRIESWPFTDAVADLLGARMTFKGQFRADWMRLHAGLDRALFRGRFKAGLVWYNILPEAEARSWRSGLGFPVGSIDEHVLETDHLQLGAIALGGFFPLWDFLLQLELFQFLYGNIHNNTGSPSDGDGSPPSTPPDGSSGNQAGQDGWYGGTFARVGCSYRF